MENWLGCERLLYSIRMEGRRARGRPKSTWRRRKSWAVVKAVAQDRKCWSGSSMEALCANWRDEIWWWLDMMTHDDDALWNLTLAKKLPVIDKITASCPTNIPPRHYIKRCKQQNELIEKLLDSIIWSLQKHYCNPVSIFFKFGLRLCPNLYLLCYLYTSFSLFEQFFLCFILTFVAVFHCFNLINFLNTLSFFKQTAGRNNLISLLWQVIFILQNFFETTLISIASNAVTYRTITTEKACFKLKGIYWRPVIELLSEMSRFSVSSDWNKHKLLLEA